MNEAELVLVGELLDTGYPAPKPGPTYVIPLMRYRVVRVERGDYPHEHILVGHDLPQLGSPTLRIGDRYRLHLTSHFPERASILNKWEDDGRALGWFFCLSFEVDEP